MSSVSTPVIVVVSVLAGALLVTSAILIYKLRPGRLSFPGKPSAVDSEPLSPVRRLTVVRGKCVDGPSPGRSVFGRLSLYSSRRNSFSSFSSLHGEGEPRKPPKALTPGDLEAQTYVINEKRALYRIDEQSSQPDIPRQTRKEKKKSTAKPKRASVPHDSLTFSSWQEYNGHRPMLDELASPITASFVAPTEAKKTLVTDKSEKQSPTKPTDTAKPLRKVDQNRPEMTTVTVARLNSYDKELPEPPKSRGKRHQKTTVDTSVIKAASVSAKPRSAYSSKPTPESSLDSQSVNPVSQRSSVYSTDSDGQPTELHSLEPLPDIPKIDLSLWKLATSDEGAKKDVNSETSPIPVSQYSRVSERHSRARARSESRSRSRSHSSKHRSRSRSRSRRARKTRPPPIKVSSHRLRALPTVVATAASSDADDDDQTFETPATLLYSPESNVTVPTGPLLSEHRDESPPPFLSARITNVISPSFTAIPKPGKTNRQSFNTIASSQFSPTFSLASVKRVPLYPGKSHLQSLKRKPVGEDTKPEQPDSTRANVSIPSALRSSNQSNPSPPLRAKPTRRESIQAQDYNAILDPSKKEPSAPRIQVYETSPEASDYEGIVKETRLSHDPFQNSQGSSTAHKSVPPPPKTAYAGLSPELRERVISIPIGRRRNSRYSHLFSKDSPPPIKVSSPDTTGSTDAKTLITSLSTPPDSAPIQSLSFGKRSASSVNDSLPRSRNSRVSTIPGVVEISPVATPEKRKSSGDQIKNVAQDEEEELGEEVSPLSDVFSVKATQIVGERQVGSDV